jgi:hypothetical protein
MMSYDLQAVARLISVAVCSPNASSKANWRPAAAKTDDTAVLKAIKSTALLPETWMRAPALLSLGLITLLLLIWLLICVLIWLIQHGCAWRQSNSSAAQTIIDATPASRSNGEAHQEPVAFENHPSAAEPVEVDRWAEVLTAPKVSQACSQGGAATAQMGAATARTSGLQRKRKQPRGCCSNPKGIQQPAEAAAAAEITTLHSDSTCGSASKILQQVFVDQYQSSSVVDANSAPICLGHHMSSRLRNTWTKRARRYLGFRRQRPVCHYSSRRAYTSCIDTLSYNV